MTEVGGMLRELRQRAGFTQETLGEAVGVTHEYISRVERGKISPSWRFLARFANALHIPIAGLLEAAGLVETSAVDEAEITALIAAYPDAAEIFDFLRSHPEAIAEVVKHTRYMQWELRGDEPHGGQAAGRDPQDGD